MRLGESTQVGPRPQILTPGTLARYFLSQTHKIFLSVGQWSHAVSGVRGREGCARDALPSFSCRYRKKFT